MHRWVGVTELFGQQALSARIIDDDTAGESPAGSVMARSRSSIDTKEFQRFLEHAVQLGKGKPQSLKSWIDFAEAWQITRVLKHCRGNRSAAARSLGIGRRTLYSKMDKLSITASWDI